MQAAPRTILYVVIVALAVALGAAPAAPEATERWFSTGIYPRVQQLLTPVSNAVPFALFDVLAGIAVAALVAVLVCGARQARRVRQAAPMLRAVARVVVGAALIYLTFLLLWGFNYRRVPMTERLLVEAGAPMPEAVVQLGLDAAARLNALHDAAHQSGWREAPWQDATLREAFTQVQRNLSDAPPAVPGRLKRTVFGPYLRWASIDGMVNPFGLEALANPDLLPFERPFIAAHEWAHLAGYADEAEASFVGWLTCVRADVEAQYSGWLALYWQVASEVNEMERARLAGALDPGPRRDVEAIVARIRRGEWPWLQQAGWRLYDRYLKANRVEEGVRSYGAVVTLVLRARFADGWVPVRRGFD
ncbi:MAG: DUF3810 family protein [Acidobacteria bacterium]|nr:DUF3810 family protein [Acidobacteriota bacterium]